MANGQRIPTLPPSHFNSNAAAPSSSTVSGFVDTSKCYNGLSLADGNGDNKIEQNEYAAFVQYVSPIGLLDNVTTFAQLPLVLQANFFVLACLCHSRGEGEGCCVGNNATIPISGAHPWDKPTDKQISFLYLVCWLTNQSIDKVLKSIAPTVMPSSSPTVISSNHPPVRKTPSPTAEPTSIPTPHPTHKPSKMPHPVPTKRPSLRPTRRPTHRPTLRKTPKPTRHQTPQPTTQPTRRPTPRQTPQPTQQRTPKPTRRQPHQPTEAVTCSQRSVCGLVRFAGQTTRVDVP